ELRAEVKRLDRADDAVRETDPTGHQHDHREHRGEDVPAPARPQLRRGNPAWRIHRGGPPLVSAERQRSGGTIDLALVSWECQGKRGILDGAVLGAWQEVSACSTTANSQSFGPLSRTTSPPTNRWAPRRWWIG